MSIVNVTNVVVENPQDYFLSPIRINITFEVVQELPKEIEWKLVYIGSPKDVKFDQVLDSFCMGPLQPGVMQFVMETNPPNLGMIPSKDDLFGVTALILSVYYLQKEFFRCGYYVYNNYVEQELLENEPINPMIEKIVRHICHDKPRVTKFNIQWNNCIEYRMPIMETNHTFMFQPLQDLSNTFQPVQQQEGYEKQQMQQLQTPQIFQQQVPMPMFQQQQFL